MKKDIDEILAAYLNKAPLTEEERREFEAWKNSSVHNKKVGKLILKLEKQKQILARHQSHKVAFDKVQRQVRQSKRKRQLVLWFILCGRDYSANRFFLPSPSGEYLHENTNDQSNVYLRLST